MAIAGMTMNIYGDKYLFQSLNHVITKGSKVAATSCISGADGFVVYLNDLHGVGLSMTDKSTVSVVE